MDLTLVIAMKGMNSSSLMVIIKMENAKILMSALVDFIIAIL